jgi:hypothetical protein
MELYICSTACEGSAISGSQMLLETLGGDKASRLRLCPESRTHRHTPMHDVPCCGKDEDRVACLI